MRLQKMAYLIACLLSLSCKSRTKASETLAAHSKSSVICTHTKDECYKVCKSPTKEPYKDEALCPQDGIHGEWACSCTVTDSPLPSEPTGPAGFNFMGCMYLEGCNAQLCSGRIFRYYREERCGDNMIACYCSEK